MPRYMTACVLVNFKHALEKDPNAAITFNKYIYKGQYNEELKNQPWKDKT